jgi:hypothetical protein
MLSDSEASRYHKNETLRLRSPALVPTCACATPARWREPGRASAGRMGTPAPPGPRGTAGAGRCRHGDRWHNGKAELPGGPRHWPSPANSMVTCPNLSKLHDSQASSSKELGSLAPTSGTPTVYRGSPQYVHRQNRRNPLLPT